MDDAQQIERQCVYNIMVTTIIIFCKKTFNNLLSFLNVSPWTRPRTSGTSLAASGPSLL